MFARVKLQKTVLSRISLLILSRNGYISYRVSTDGDISDDEEDEDQYNNSLDSFIDDRASPRTMATQSATSRTDMMAIYRSLASPPPVSFLLHDKVQLDRKLFYMFYALHNNVI